MWQQQQPPPMDTMAPPTGISFRGAPQRSSLEYPFRADDSRPQEPSPIWAADSKGLLPALPSESRTPSTKIALLLLGTAILLLVVIIPLWDAMTLLEDDVVLFFIGKAVPRLVGLACISAVTVYIVTFVLVMRCGKEMHKTEQTIMMIGVIVMTSLGLAFLCLSLPLRTDSLAVIDDLFYNCEYGQSTEELYKHAAALQRLRSFPSCAELRSVELCDGFHESQPHTDFMKNLESGYRCAGFCSAAFANFSTQAVFAKQPTQVADLGRAASNASSHGVVSPPQATSAARSGLLASALQHLVRQKGEAGEILGIVAGGDDARGGVGIALLGTAAWATTQEAHSAEPGKIADYPPTLFSQRNNEVSCEGMAAWTLKYEALELAQLLYAEGLALLFASVIVSLLKLGGMCLDGRRSMSTGDSYSEYGTIKPRTPKPVIM